MQTYTRILFSAVILFVLIVMTHSIPLNSARADQVQQRLTVFISDLHWGIGRDSKGEWNPMEDFRWPNAIKGFLDAVSSSGSDAVDLIIVGDLLDLWQPPDSVKCKGRGDDLGCTVEEMKEIVSAVVSAHKNDFKSLRDFMNKGSNRIYLIPGNHDAALLLPDIWNIVSKELQVPDRRLTFVPSGIWISDDGKIFAEHGHQIGSDVNCYSRWPKITATVNGKEFITRPWGELFVQRIFNEIEEGYPIIDNLIPETAGLRYRMADRGFKKSTSDVARFIAFNLFETSFQQKISTLGISEPSGTIQVSWSRDKMVKLGYRLFTESMAPEDPFRQMIEENSTQASELRQELNNIVTKMPDEDLKKLCANITAIGNPDLCSATLGDSIERVMPRSAILTNHFLQREKEMPELKNAFIFVYGHTHQMELPWACKLNFIGSREKTVVNTGAFQRLLSEEGFLKRAGSFKKSEEGLRKISIEELPACYSFVYIKNGPDDIPEPVVQTWHMEEGGKGSFNSPGIEICK